MQLNIHNFTQPAVLCDQGGRVLEKNFSAQQIKWIANSGETLQFFCQAINTLKCSDAPKYFAYQEKQTKIFFVPFKKKDSIFYFLLLEQKANLLEHDLVACNNNEQNKELAKLYKELQLAKELIYKDSLTGLFNRNYWEKLVISLQEECFCLLFLDLDNFKNYNDVYGHLTGDALLKKIALIIQNNLYQGDVAMRYAGDEFLIVVRNTLKAESIAQKIRKNIAKNFLVRGITASIGIGSFPKDGSTPLEILQFADNQLYLAKKLDKTKVVFDKQLTNTN